VRLNTPTKLYTENRLRGLLLCGINWGGDPSRPSGPEAPSFFSDQSVNNYRYRNRLVHWFELLGFPLITVKGQEGAFEHSLLQTNWLPGQAPHMHDEDIVALCVSNAAPFIDHVRQLRPALIVLVGLALFRALNNPTVLAQVESLMGRAGEARVLQKSITTDGGQVLKAFSIGLRSFERTQVVAFPHPTGSVGLSDLYIESFKPELAPVFARYRDELLGRLKTGG